MTSTARQVISPAMITPDLMISDEHAAYWLAQVNLRLRREVAWCWFQRMDQPMVEGILPPITNAAAENLDMVRFAEQKRQFFAADPACVFLTEQIQNLPYPESHNGRWYWVARELALSEAEQFVLALALSIQIDASLAPIFSTCLNDLNRPFATLALAQRLWQHPQQIMPCADPQHPFFRYGLIKATTNAGNLWSAQIDMPAMVAQQLVEPEAGLPAGLIQLALGKKRDLPQSAELLLVALRQVPKHQHKYALQIVPLLGAKDSAFEDWVITLVSQVGRRVVSIPRQLLSDPALVSALLCVCWLREFDLLFSDDWAGTDKSREIVDNLSSAQSIPVTCFVPCIEAEHTSYFSGLNKQPALTVPALTFEQRTEHFKQKLGELSSNLEQAIEECARRFRFEERTIEKVVNVLKSSEKGLNEDNLLSICANFANVGMTNLAQLVTPRFDTDELILPTSQSQQIEDILHAMRTLTTVHYHWGTAKVWNESGLSVLFCGTPGTGKTMAAEAISNQLDLPMYRIDLSQVVNKYIGETEKNLKRIFDAAEQSDCILFFDEADALFGKRTDVKDAHDRFANIEISYLLERMERFKGLAILATNRRKDLDEAFMRRLRYVIEFPVPGFQERLRIWQQVFPKNLDISDLDIRYLAKQFQLSGGHIRSAVFNACLRAANHKQSNAPAKIGMRDLLIAIKRELEKVNRSASDELFGAYRHLLESAP